MRTWQSRRSTRTIALRLLDADGAPVEGIGVYLRGAGTSWHTTTATDTDGRLRVDVEPGTFEVLVMPRRLAAEDRRLFNSHWDDEAPQRHPLAAHLLSLGELTATAGGTTEAELRLPKDHER